MAQIFYGDAKGFRQRLGFTGNILRSWIQDYIRPPFDTEGAQFKRTSNQTSSWTPLPVGNEGSNPAEYVFVHPNPILRVALSTAILAGSFFFGDAVSVKSASDNAAQKPEWIQPQSQPYPLPDKKKTLQAIEAGSFFYVDQSVVEKEKSSHPDWIPLPKLPPSEWTRPTQNLGGEAFDVNQKWIEKEKSSHPDWIPLPKNPPSEWTRPTQNLGGMESRSYVYAAAEVITVDKWFRLTEQPFFPRSLHASRLEGFTIDRIRSLEPETFNRPDWIQPISQPFFPRSLHASRLEGFTIDRIRSLEPETQNRADWHQPQAQPFFSARRILPAIQSGAWFYGDQQSTEIEKSKKEDWFHIQSVPYFPKRIHPSTLGYSVRAEILLPPSIPALFSWNVPQQQPVIKFLPRQNLGGEMVRPTVWQVVVEVITVDKWFRETLQPYFSRILSSAIQAGSFFSLGSPIPNPPTPPAVVGSGGGRPVIWIRPDDDNLLLRLISEGIL